MYSPEFILVEDSKILKLGQDGPVPKLLSAPEQFPKSSELKICWSPRRMVQRSSGEIAGAIFAVQSRLDSTRRMVRRSEE